MNRKQVKAMHAKNYHVRGLARDGGITIDGTQVIKAKSKKEAIKKFEQRNMKLSFHKIKIVGMDN